MCRLAVCMSCMADGMETRASSAMEQTVTGQPIYTLISTLCSVSRLQAAAACALLATVSELQKAQLHSSLTGLHCAQVNLHHWGLR